MPARLYPGKHRVFALSIPIIQYNSSLAFLLSSNPNISPATCVVPVQDIFQKAKMATSHFYEQTRRQRE